MNPLIVLLIVLGIVLVGSLVLFKRKRKVAFLLFFVIAGAIIGSQLPNFIAQYHQAIGGVKLEIKKEISELKSELIEYHQVKSSWNRQILKQIESETNEAIELAELGENSKSFSKLKKEKDKAYRNLLSASEEDLGSLDQNRIQLEDANLVPLSELDGYIRLKMKYAFGRLTRISYIDLSLSTSGFSLYKTFFTHIESPIWDSTIERYRPGLTFTSEGWIAAGAGAFAGVLVWFLFFLIFRKKGGSK